MPATRTWVSGTGNDVDPGSRTAPCKTFAGAISKTADGGEIDVLDPGGFGAVTILKSITIDATGTFASILASGTFGIVINAAGIDVTIRGLQINGAGGGITGIRIVAANRVHIQDCAIFGFTGGAAIGINDVRTAGGKLFRNPALAATYKRVLAEAGAGGKASGRDQIIERAMFVVGIAAGTNFHGFEAERGNFFEHGVEREVVVNRVEHADGDFLFPTRVSG